jgi:hypothetical protein
MLTPSGTSRHDGFIREGARVTALPVEMQDPDRRCKLFYYFCLPLSAPIFADISVDKAAGLYYYMCIHPTSQKLGCEHTFLLPSESTLGIQGSFFVRTVIQARYKDKKTDYCESSFTQTPSTAKNAKSHAPYSTSLEFPSFVAAYLKPVD